MTTTNYTVGDSVFVIDGSLSPVIKTGTVTETRDGYVANIGVDIDDSPREMWCLDEQIIHQDAEDEEVTSFLQL